MPTDIIVRGSIERNHSLTLLKLPAHALVDVILYPCSMTLVALARLICQIRIENVAHKVTVSMCRTGCKLQTKD